ncbi:hypothetical protein ACFL59_13395 [Planctomycetota bacterium]
MRFEKVNVVTRPPALILETMIERMEQIVPFLPSVESIETLETTRHDDGRVHILRKWQGTAESAPKAVRPFLSKEALAWLDDAWWTADEHKVDWNLSTSLSKLYTCGGTNYFEPSPDDPDGATIMRITGDLEVFPDKMPGIPKFLGRKLAPQVEKFVVKLLTPNLTDLAKGLQGYFDSLEK